MVLEVLASVFDCFNLSSNAFIFAIVFGLIVDDSIHILSSYRFNVKRGMSKDKALDKSLTGFIISTILLRLSYSACFFTITHT